MKKISILLSLLLAVTSLVGCNSGKQGSNGNSDNTIQTEIATQPVTENTTTMGEQTENKKIRNIDIKRDEISLVTVKEIDTVMIKQEYLDQMTQDGAYALNDGNQLVVVFVNKDGYEYDTEVYAYDTEVYVYYETELSDDIEPRIDDDAYLINGYKDVNLIKIYKDGKETDFVSIIPCENIFK